MSEVEIAPAQRQRSLALVSTDRALIAFVSLLLFAPSAIFAASLRPLAAALVIAGCAGGVALATARQASVSPLLDQRIDLQRLVLSIAVAGVILILGGEMHLVFANYDWRIRDAVLSDLVSAGRPPLYTVEGADYLLRAPLGMYMIPAAIGQALGRGPAHVAMWAQNSLFLGAMLYLFGRIGRGWAHVAILVLFAGCALAGIGFALALGLQPDVQHILNFSLDSWNPYFQYSSTITQYFWVPNHALPGWWLGLLMILQTRREIDIATIAASIGGALFWSPLVVIPVAVWIAGLALWNIRETIASPRNWLAALTAACFLPVALFLVVGASSIPYGLSATKDYFLLIYLLFMTAQMVQPAYLLVERAQVPKEMIALLIFSVCTLLVLPAFNFGPSNDLVMRGSIPTLVVIAFAFGSVVLDSRTSARARAIGLAIAVVSSASAAIEIWRIIDSPRFPISDCTLFEAGYGLGGVGIPGNYAVRSDAIPGWLMRLDDARRLPIEDRRCWPDIDWRRQFDALP